MKYGVLKRLVAILITLAVEMAAAGEIRVAVASNFSDVIKSLSTAYEQRTGHKVTLIIGSTGKLYAQVLNGAPFDAFFAADIKRPKLLEEDNVAIPGSRFTYAIGKIILWSPQQQFVDSQGRVLEQGDFRHLAIANPKLAPYGRAAEEILRARGVWDELQAKAVRGENIGQTFLFVASGNAELGLVAYSQVKRPNESVAGSWWDVPQELYTPIQQQAVLLTENETARDFLLFIKSDLSLEIIRGFGYSTP